MCRMICVGGRWVGLKVEGLFESIIERDVYSFRLHISAQLDTISCGSVVASDDDVDNDSDGLINIYLNLGCRSEYYIDTGG